MTFIPPNPHIIKENYNPSPGDMERIIELPETKKPTHAKPALYAHVYEIMKDIARAYGYNLLIHGSLNRDLDLLAVPWFSNFTFSPNRDKFIEALRSSVGGTYNEGHGDELSPGRYSYVINLNRGGYIGDEYKADPQYYIDISIMASFTEMRDENLQLQQRIKELDEHISRLLKLDSERGTF